MGVALSHWGFIDSSDSDGSYSTTRIRQVRPAVGMILTEAGEVLINSACNREMFQVGIVIGRDAHGLSRPQAERMQRAWDVAMAVTGGNPDNVLLQPMPHHWRFSRADYLTIDEWQRQNIPTMGQQLVGAVQPFHRK